MNTIKSIVLSLVVGMTLMFSGGASALEGALLGLTTGNPLVDTNPVGSCDYDPATEILTIETQPFFITFDAAATNINIITDVTGSYGADWDPLEISDTTAFTDDFISCTGCALQVDTFVPVPAAVWLFGSGLFGLIGVGARNRARRTS
ncbi:MAG: VPLPA-CTERM sorting domain-containing protein [Gammaproteobacteria bacterium]